MANFFANYMGKRFLKVIPCVFQFPRNSGNFAGNSHRVPKNTGSIVSQDALSGLDLASFFTNSWVARGVTTL